MSKKLPFDESVIKEIVKQYPTPFHIYDETGIRRTAKALNSTFDWSPNYRNFFAIKANPNPYILEILKDEGMGVDAASLPELILAKAAGLKGQDIIFTSNNTPPEDYQMAYKLGALINLDDINQIEALESALDGKFPETISFRYNPGPDIILDASTNSIGNPTESKFGVTTEQLPEAYKLAGQKGAKHFGLHTMIVTNELDTNVHVQIARLIFKTALRLYKEAGIMLDFIDLGGGLGIPYLPDQPPIDLEALKQGVRDAYNEIIIGNGLKPIRIVTEYGRFVMAPNGYMVTTVRSLKRTYHNFVGMDATSADLLRAGVYDLYHHITVLGKAADRPLLPQRLTGSMCENNDTLTGTQDRMLTELKVGDVVVFHDTGAHGHALGYNYNAKLRHGELLLRPNGTVKHIRRNQTIDDYFETLDYPGLQATSR